MAESESSEREQKAREDDDRWRRYVETGEHVSQEQMARFFDGLEAVARRALDQE